MNKDLLIEKLSVIATMCEDWTREGSTGSIEDNIMIQERMSIIRRNVTACLLELSEADCVSELSPDEEEMLEEYEASCEKEEIKVGTTEDGFHYLI